MFECVLATGLAVRRPVCLKKGRCVCVCVCVCAYIQTVSVGGCSVGAEYFKATDCCEL